ncbi:MAG: hypothetical protein O3A10_15190 [Chloroflexi bacterium]|nr:hypothetical protein [Chloroflexota bacterium]MDA1147845.1 hypothetical protein [Chloroflexota bacterium]
MALATFHTTLLVLVVLGLVYFGGGLGDALDGLNTVAGLWLFVYLWLITWVTTAEALRRIGWPSLVRRHDILPQSMLWGGVSGVATVAVAAPIGMIAVLVIGVAKQDTDALGLAIFLPIGAAISSPFAFAVGAFVGMFVGLTDSLLVAVSAAIIRVRSPEADSL